MSLDALLTKLEAREVTPVTVVKQAAVTTTPLQNKACTAATPVTALNDIAIDNIVYWQGLYKRLVTHNQNQGNSLNESQWRAINETVLQCCEAHNVSGSSDEGFNIQNILTAITGFNPKPINYDFTKN